MGAEGQTGWPVASCRRQPGGSAKGSARMARELRQEVDEVRDETGEALLPIQEAEERGYG